mgnify:CR=1 FL=1
MSFVNLAIVSHCVLLKCFYLSLLFWLDFLGVVKTGAQGQVASVMITLVDEHNFLLFHFGCFGSEIGATCKGYLDILPLIIYRKDLLPHFFDQKINLKFLVQIRNMTNFKLSKILLVVKSFDIYKYY